MTPFDSKCQNQQMVPIYFCLGTHRFSHIHILNVWPSNSWSRSGSQLSPWQRLMANGKSCKWLPHSSALARLTVSNISNIFNFDLQKVWTFLRYLSPFQIYYHFKCLTFKKYVKVMKYNFCNDVIRWQISNYKNVILHLLFSLRYYMCSRL